MSRPRFCISINLTASFSMWRNRQYCKDNYINFKTCFRRSYFIANICLLYIGLLYLFEYLISFYIGCGYLLNFVRDCRLRLYLSKWYIEMNRSEENKHYVNYKCMKKS